MDVDDGVSVYVFLVCAHLALKAVIAQFEHNALPDHYFSGRCALD